MKSWNVNKMRNNFVKKKHFVLYETIDKGPAEWRILFEHS